MTAKKLAAWRAALGISQVAAAEALGISIRQYIRYEMGDRPIPLLVDLATEALTQKRKEEER